VATCSGGAILPRVARRMSCSAYTSAPADPGGGGMTRLHVVAASRSVPQWQFWASDDELWRSEWMDQEKITNLCRLYRFTLKATLGMLYFTI
jgi:hypothetical protein